MRWMKNVSLGMLGAMMTLTTQATRPESETSRVLADFLAATTFADVPSPVVADAKLAVLDWFGSALAGALEPPARFARDHKSAHGAVGQIDAFLGRDFGKP